MASPTVKELFDEVAALTARVATVEDTARSNRERLDALDAARGAQAAELDRVRAEAERDRWYAKYRRRR